MTQTLIPEELASSTVLLPLGSFPLKFSTNIYHWAGESEEEPLRIPPGSGRSPVYRHFSLLIGQSSSQSVKPGFSYPASQAMLTMDGGMHKYQVSAR